jgi:hypothetical protein
VHCCCGFAMGRRLSWLRGQCLCIGLLDGVDLPRFSHSMIRLMRVSEEDSNLGGSSLIVASSRVWERSGTRAQDK